MPDPIMFLPVYRGYPVPWFVGWVDEDGHATSDGEGTPDFRVIGPDKIAFAHRFERCWVCGRKRGRHVSFVIGPMCAVTRVSSEPPSHLECGDWAARACPFLTRPHVHRRDNNLPAERQAPAGFALDRNPGVTLVWTTRTYRPFAAPGGVLFNLGGPGHVRWYREGRAATRAEVMESIESGLPTLREFAEAEGPRATRQLDAQYERALTLLPAA